MWSDKLAVIGRPKYGVHTVRTRTNNEFIGTIEPLGISRGYKAVRPDGTQKIEALRMFAVQWLVIGYNQAQGIDA